MAVVFLALLRGLEPCLPLRGTFSVMQPLLNPLQNFCLIFAGFLVILLQLLIFYRKISVGSDEFLQEHKTIFCQIWTNTSICICHSEQYQMRPIKTSRENHRQDHTIILKGSDLHQPYEELKFQGDLCALFLTALCCFASL